MGTLAHVTTRITRGIFFAALWRARCCRSGKRLGRRTGGACHEQHRAAWPPAHLRDAVPTVRRAGADEIRPDEARVAKAIQDGLGVMPAFRDKLSAQDIALLARYVSKAAAAKH